MADPFQPQRCAQRTYRTKDAGAYSPLRALPCAIALLLALGGCGTEGRSQVSTNTAVGAIESGDGESIHDGSGLQSSLHGVETVERLAPSAFEEKRAAAGHRLLVLDISVHNRSKEPRVFLEGRVVAVGGATERTFARPVEMLSEGFLSLQVLEPSARVRGRIVYQIPRQLEGPLYWIPGDGKARIALDRMMAATGAAGAGPRPVRRAGPQEEALQPVVVLDGAAAAVAVATSIDRGGVVAPVARQVPDVAAVAGARKLWSGEGRWPAREGPAFECADAWKRVEHIICSDETLARMDWELDRAYAIARGSVEDREALQRQEQQWKSAVRDECTTRDCVEAVYETRIGQLYSMARR